MPTSRDDRRWFIPSMSDSRIGDRAYFDALGEEMAHDGPAALLHHLAHVDIKSMGVDLRTAPTTRKKGEQKEQSLTPEEAWWLDCLSSGELVESRDMVEPADWETGPVRVGRGGMYRSYQEWVRLTGARWRLTEKGFWAKLDRMCADASGKPLIKRARNRAQLLDWMDERRRAEGKMREGRFMIVPDLKACRAAFERWAHQLIDWNDAGDTDGVVLHERRPTDAAAEDATLPF